MSSSNLSSATEEKSKAKSGGGPAEAEKVSKPAFDETDLCTVIHRNWGLNDPASGHPYIPATRETYLDRYTFFGGVARHVPYEQAKRWVKLGVISNEHIFPDNAQMKDFMRVTGRDPLSPANLASAIQTISPEKIAMMLGDEAAKSLAKDIMKLVNSRKPAEDED